MQIPVAEGNSQLSDAAVNGLSLAIPINWENECLGGLKEGIWTVSQYPLQYHGSKIILKDLLRLAIFF